MARPHPLREMVSEAVRDVIRSDSIDQALAALADRFQVEYDLWRASVVLLLRKRARIVAVWSVGEPTLDAGMEIPLSLTPSVQAVADELRAGRPLLLDPASMDLGLISDVYRREGVRSWLAIPLRDEGSFRAVLNLASSREGAFEPVDASLFGALAVGIERHLLTLIPEDGEDE